MRHSERASRMWGMLTPDATPGTQVNGRIALSTKTLEPEPGDMIKNPQKVYDMAEVRSERIQHRMVQLTNPRP